jgi:RNA polymerase primary sigma factor
VKNGPVYSNISNINRAYGIFGSPLHVDLIIDYVRTHWENGRGTSLEDAQSKVKYPIEAQFYYSKAEEEDHYSRKIVACEKLNDLYNDMRWNPNPWLLSAKTIPVNIKEIYLDPRFDVVSSDEGKTYLILTDWNLLNDLVFRLLLKRNLKKIPIAEVYREVIMKYSIDDPNAYFFPKIDPRFKIGGGSTVSLASKEVYEEPLSGQVTDYIKESVAIKLPEIKSYLAEKDYSVKIREIIQKIFLIQPHFTLFTAYFEAVKQSLSLMNNIFLVNEDSLVFTADQVVPDRIDVKGNTTDFKALNKKITEFQDGLAQHDEAQTTSSQSGQQQTTAVIERDSLSYTLRYFDRIQETLTAHYFKDWIEDGYVKVLFLDNNEETPLVFHYDESQNIIYGEHLSNFMIDYDLEPGQKLEFKQTQNSLQMRLGIFDENAHTEQMKYEDIARLSEIKHYGTKSLLQNLAELLILHPSGMHIRQIVLDIKGETSYAESSIRGALSSYPIFETIPGKIGYWRFNPRQWKKTYLDLPKQNPIKKNKVQPVLIEGTALSLPEIFKNKAFATQKNRRKLTNKQYQMLPKEKFLELAWEYYSFIIYQYAKNNKCDLIPLEDFYQEAFFALNKAYEGYKPFKGNSFYRYFKIRLSAHIHRFKADRMGMIRIPVHRAEELGALDKGIPIYLLLEGHANIPQEDEHDYTLYKSNYIGIEELYLKDSRSTQTIDELSARIYSFFDNPIYLDDVIDRKVAMNYTNIEEPEHCDYLVDEENFVEKSLNNIIAQQALDYLKNTVKKHRDYGVILHRNGFTTGKEMTLEEVGELYGVTRERVRQIEAKSMAILKKYKGLKGEPL